MSAELQKFKDGVQGESVLGQAVVCAGSVGWSASCVFLATFWLLAA